MGRKKTKMGGEKKKRKFFFFIFIFPLLACVCVCVGYIRFHSIRQTHAQLTHREPEGNKKQLKQPQKVSKQNKKGTKKLRWLVGKPWEKVEIIDEKNRMGNHQKTAILFLLSGSNLTNCRYTHTHTNTADGCVNSNPTPRGKKSTTRNSIVCLYAMDG